MNPLILVILPQVNSSFTNGLSVQVGLPGQVPYATVVAALQPNGTWTANLMVNPDVQIFINLIPVGQAEPKPYPKPNDWINTSRTYTPALGLTTIYTVEGMYGISATGLPIFADPTPTRLALMQTTFGAPIVATGIFGANEMPHGVTYFGTDCYFVLHAPHAVIASLVLIDTDAAGRQVRRLVPMNLTRDAVYWWCVAPAAQVPFGKKYRFSLNEGTEVLDPAARQVLDAGDFDVSPADDPNLGNASWSLTLDVDTVRATAGDAQWQTLGWESLLIYEIHAKRFIDINPNGLTPLQIVADETKSVNRMGSPGYLYKLPITAIELMPIHEFQSGDAWGYGPAFFFAIDDFYGGATSLANLVQTAHSNGKGVILDLVYNHTWDSPLDQIASDVYSNGDNDGPQINSGQPMVLEYFRQATIYLVRTFGVDGYRFDDTMAILNKPGGWAFLGAIRDAIRTASTVLGRNWPYCVGENDPNGWNMTNPAWSIMDGRWCTEETWDLNNAASNPWVPGSDNSGSLQNDMSIPESWLRPFHEATRFGESHDSASNQQTGRIAARPPYGMGLQMAKAVGTLVLLSNGVPMVFCGQEVGDVTAFVFANNVPAVNPQQYDLPDASANDNTRILAWFRLLMGLRNDPSKGLRGDSNIQYVKTGNRTIAFTCGNNAQQMFVIVTFGTPNQQQDSSWLGLPGGGVYKEIFNSSWPVFQVEFEQEQSNGGYDARISSGQVLNLPYIGGVVLERC